MTNKDRREIAALLALAADLAVAKHTLDPDWPAWRKRLHWQELDPQITRFQERARALTGASVPL